MPAAADTSIDARIARTANLNGIREYLTYDPETGVFEWIKRPHGFRNWKPGAIAGCRRKDGYLIINWKGEAYLGHHLAWWFVNGVLPEKLDHRDRRPSNNRYRNLRPCTQSQNMGNANKRRTGSSQYRGVSRHRAGGWTTGVCGKYGGYFQSEEAAARAYDAAAKAKFGEFANLNFKD